MCKGESRSQSAPYDTTQVPTPSLIVQLKVHPVVYLVVADGDVVLEDGVPFLEHYLVPPRPRLCRDQLLEVPYGVVRVAFDSNFFAESIVARHLV
ncbi:hypothetical protein Pmani_036651 [Petrolisthes manimaculis]|uniref:Uncharacterized protein n=1 Tax=Petrolisthes manimaculis TaxID=1843537 RepID=A0AAE1TP70_9EUCA|nr:hypothetical protein Pmani_036651 [Petrolisthes manimaculis]